jgi:hypothetical protein
LARSIPHLFSHLGGRFNASVAARVTMTVTAHKTRNGFDRYHIVSPTDLKAAGQELPGRTTGTLG